MMQTDNLALFNYTTKQATNDETPDGTQEETPDGTQEENQEETLVENQETQEEPAETLDDELRKLVSKSKVEEIEEIKMMDSDGDISLYNYISCDNDSPDYLKFAHGLVYDGDNLVFSSFAYSHEYVADNKNMDFWNQLEQFDLNTLHMMESHEGFLIRVFNLKDKWFISTHHKLDAYKSRWSSKDSFGEIFEKAINAEYELNPAFKKQVDTSKIEGSVIERFLSTLDTSMCYAFLTRNNEENRIVCNAPERPEVYHVGEFERGSFIVSRNINLGLPKPKTITNKRDVIDIVSSMDFVQKQGVIIFTPKGQQFKIYNPDYKKYYDARGNESSIKFRYLTIRMDYEKRNRLLELYPDQFESMVEYENTIYKIAKHLKNLYIQRYIHKNVSTLPPHEFRIISLCHKWHRLDRKENRVSLETIMNVLNEQKPSFLNRFIKDFNQETLFQKTNDITVLEKIN